LKFILLASLSLLIIDMPTALATHSHWHCKEYNPRLPDNGCARGGGNREERKSSSPSRKGKGGTDRPSGRNPGGNPCGGNCGVGLGNGGGNGTGNEGGGQGPGGNGRPPQTNPGGAGGNS